MPGAPGGTLRFDPGRTARFDRTRRAWITTDRFRDVVYPSAWQPMPQPPSGTR